MLPGFVGSDAPAGIPDYHPSRAAILLAKTFSKSFNYKRRALREHSILALFLMGSVSSIAFSRSSDMDIWLCRRPDLSSEQLAALRSKTLAVEQWAAGLGLEVHFFVLDNEQFRAGQDTPISFESSGKTQHYLLLEEFYRTAIHIAGRMPAWWFVPPHQEGNYSTYVAHLQHRRFISKREIIDFGGLEHVPADEFISATLWHLYKAISSPHKSLLKLLLMECYASEFPDPAWLCLDLKKAVYRGQFAIDAVDPYLLIYQKVDQYLLRAQSVGRLALARQSLYMKIIGDPDTLSDPKIRRQRQEFIASIARNWNWPENMLAELNRRKSWNIRKATQQHAIILQQLIKCYRMTMGFAGKHVQHDKQQHADIRLLGRKLYSYLERRPGKVEIITTRASLHSQDMELTLVESTFATGDLGWGLYQGLLQTRDAQHHEALKKSWNLMEILVWLVVNGLYHKKLQVHLQSDNFCATQLQIHELLQSLKQFLDNHCYGATTPLDAYRKGNRLKTSLAFINLCLPLPETRDHGRHVISERNDVLSYGAARENFVRSIDRVSISTWGEISVKRYLELDGLFDLLMETIADSVAPFTSDTLAVACHTPVRGRSIALRLEGIINRLAAMAGCLEPGKTARYLLPGEQHYYVIQNKNGRFSHWRIDHEEALLEELGRQQEVYSRVLFDPEVLKNTPIPFIYDYNRAGIIQVFCLARKTTVDIYILDEKGALFHQQHDQAPVKQLLTAYAAFLQSILRHSLPDDALTISYYEIQKNSAALLSCIPIELDPAPLWQYLNVRVIGEQGNSGRMINYTVYCNNQEFSSMEYGEQVFKMAAKYVLQFRQTHKRYPIRITDIDIPVLALGVDNSEQLQTVHFLKYKRKIEYRLNA